MQALRLKIREEYKRPNTEKWNALIEENDKERNNREYWQSNKRMVGKSSTTEIMNLRGHNNEEVHEDEGKEEILGRIGRRFLTFQKRRMQNLM